MRLLLIEDNRDLSALIVSGLKPRGFTTDAVSLIADGAEALEVAQYDAVILDILLPDGDGLDLLKTLRARNDATPVLMLTARDTVADVVAGLDSGADDYVLKPVAIDELAARLRALLRRPGGVLGVRLTTGNVVLDTVSRQVWIDDRIVALSKRETDSLELLLRRTGNVVSRQAIEEGIYGFNEEINPNTLEVLISRLRRRLIDQGADVAIHTVRGVGYVLAGPRGATHLGLEARS